MISTPRAEAENNQPQKNQGHPCSLSTSAIYVNAQLSLYKVRAFTLCGPTFTLCVNPHHICGLTHKLKLSPHTFQSFPGQQPP
jgi:hypothetical protein